MLSRTLKPLRIITVGFGLLAGMASAQAQLRMTFLEDTENGHLSIVFSGQTTAHFDVESGLYGAYIEFVDNYAYTINADSPGQSYGSDELEMAYLNPLPLTGTYINAISSSGNGGFYYSANRLIVVSSVMAPAGSLIRWDGIGTFEGDLAGIGLTEGSSGTLVFTSDTGDFTIDWATAVVPEPAAYALVLGLGITGVALLRRRAKRQ